VGARLSFVRVVPTLGNSEAGPMKNRASAYLFLRLRFLRSYGCPTL